MDQVDTLRAGRLALPAGLALSYAEQGDPAGPAVVLLHGYSDSWPSQLPLMRHLPASLRVVALTLRGHGDSAKPAAGYDTASFAGDVLAAMDALGLARAALVGHSMGSLVAQRIAAEHQARVSALVLIGAFVTLKGNPAVASLWQDALATLDDPVDPGFVRAFQESSVALPVPAAFLDGVVAESLKVPAHVWRATMRALMDEDRSDRLGAITAPTLILWGDRDGFADAAEQQRLAAGIRGARLAVHAGTGHAPHWEDPQRVAASLRHFLPAPFPTVASQPAIA